jgi:hypothetical protein
LATLVYLKSKFVLSVLIAAIGITVFNSLAVPIASDMKEYVVSYADKELRVPAYDSIVYTPLWVEHLQSDLDGQKPVIGFFGSSTVYGTTVMKSANTSAGVFQSHLKDHRVLNLGLSGARFTDTYALVESMIDHVDVVVFEINYGMTVVSENEREPVAYPTLIGKLGNSIPREWLSAFPDKNQNSLPSRAHGWVASNVLNHFTLYRERDVLSYHFFKTRTPKEKIRRELEKQKGKVTPYDPMYKPYDKMSTDSKKRIDKGFRALYHWNRPFSEQDSFGLFMIGKTLELIQKHNKKAIIYSAPLDYELINTRKMLDWSDYERVMGAYRKRVEEAGYPFIEFNNRRNVIPHRLYRDPTHLTDEGNKQFGEILFNKTITLLE